MRIEDKTVALLGEVEERAIIIWEAEKGVSDQLVMEGGDQLLSNH